MRNEYRIGTLLLLSLAVVSTTRGQSAAPEAFIARAEVLGQNAGMSATVEIDTGRRGRLAALLGGSAAAQQGRESQDPER